MTYRTAREIDVLAGDVLEGVEDGVTTRIEVLYATQQTLLARWLWSVRPNGEVVLGDGRESCWTLSCRDWRRVR